MSLEQTALTEALSTYINQVSLREPPVLARLRLENVARPDGELQLAADLGQLLHLLARLMGARNAIEVGVFTGYSSTWTALALPPGGKLIACDISEENTRAASRVWRDAGVEDRVELRLGPALATLDALLEEGRAGAFDMVFIDADKANYANYYERALALLRPGGLVAVDNVLWHGRLVDPSVNDTDTQALRAFNRMVHADERVWMSFLTMRDGLTLACKK